MEGFPGQIGEAASGSQGFTVRHLPRYCVDLLDWSGLSASMPSGCLTGSKRQPSRAPAAARPQDSRLLSRPSPKSEDGEGVKAMANKLRMPWRGLAQARPRQG